MAKVSLETFNLHRPVLTRLSRLDGTKHDENDALDNVSTSLISKTDPAWPHPG